MKNAGKACNNRLYRHIRTFEKIVKNYFVIYLQTIQHSSRETGYTETIEAAKKVPAYGIRAK
mgnify:CR=1 FL=1